MQDIKSQSSLEAVRENVILETVLNFFLNMTELNCGADYV